MFYGTNFPAVHDEWASKEYPRTIESGAKFLGHCFAYYFMKFFFILESPLLNEFLVESARKKFSFFILDDPKLRYLISGMTSSEIP